MEEINNRLSKAQGVSKDRVAIAMSKVREHNTVDVQMAQEKAAKSL